MNRNMVNFAVEILVFFVFLGIFTLIPMNQLMIQGSIIALSIYVFTVSKFRGISYKQLGLDIPSKQIIIKWALVTLCMVMGVVILKIIFSDGVFNGVSKNRQAFIYLVPFYVLIGTFFQELVFRGYLFVFICPNVETVLNRYFYYN